MSKLILSAAAAAVLTFTALQSAEAGSPSFNCGYAKLPSEVAICKSSELGDMDSQMAGRYFTLVNDHSVPHRSRQQIKSEQTGWLRARNRCGYSFKCLRSSYRARINRLASWSSRFYGN